MKHIGLCLMRIEMAMSKIPNDLDSEDALSLANGALTLVKYYADILEKIIMNPKFKKNIRRLISMSSRCAFSIYS